MEANQKSNLNIEDYIPQWSNNKYQEMKSQLNGYWNEDIWYPADNPLRDKNVAPRDIGGRVCFDKCGKKIRLEIKFACYQKLADEEWSAKTIHNSAAKINLICEWLGNKHINAKSLLDKQLEEWLVSLRAYLIDENKYYAFQRVKSFRKKKYTTYKQEDGCIYIFKQIYKIVFDFYDSRDEYDKNIWDVYKLGFEDKDNGASKNRWLDFGELQYSYFYGAAKKFIRYKLALVSPKTCDAKLLAIRKFKVFLFSNHPNIQASAINREIIINYLGYLSSLDIGEGHRHRLIADLRDFFEIGFREKWLNITGNKLIYNDDLPKYKRKYSPKYIPEKVIEQIIENLKYVKKPFYGRMFLILIECGMRISELCQIHFDCIKQDSRGDFFLEYYQFKLKKDIVIPISIQTVKVIQQQQESINNNSNIFLFPSPKFKVQEKPISYTAFCDNFNELIYQKNIRDMNGKLWNFTSHQCRHTVGTRMINNDVPQHIVQRFLGHESPTMTQVYAHVHDKTLKKEIAKYHDTRVVNVAGEVVESTTPELDNDLDLHLLKKKVLAQSLPNGSCGRAIVLGKCPHANACLTCADFRTTIEFLDQHKAQLEETEKIVKNSKEKGWQIHVDMNIEVRDNLKKIITTLESGDKDIVSGAEE